MGRLNTEITDANPLGVTEVLPYITVLFSLHTSLPIIRATTQGVQETSESSELIFHKNYVTLEGKAHLRKEKYIYVLK
jgi:hypothetical protein